jgi:hypothetical protein
VTDLRSVPVSGQTELFPEDWYSIGGDFSIFLPTDTFSTTDEGAPIGPLQSSIVLGLSPGLTPFKGLAAATPDGPDFIVLLQRGFVSHFMVWSAVVSVGVLAVLVGFISSIGTQFAPLWGALTAIAATILSLVPLRSAVVPAAIEEPTRVGAVLIALTVFLVVLAVWRVSLEVHNKFSQPTARI